MKPQDEQSVAEGGAGPAEGEAEGGDTEAEWLSVAAPEAVLQWVAALNALRKSRQYYDCVLVAAGVELPAHRAVLAAAAPHLLPALAAAAGPVASLRLDADADALRQLLEYLYTGAARVRGERAALALYAAAWRLRVEPLRRAVAAHLLRRLRPGSALAVRALPGLAPDHLARLDAYVADNFGRLCEASALAPLPALELELLREGQAPAAEAARDVAAGALLYLQDLIQNHNVTLEEACSRQHLVYADADGALRDLEGRPAARDEAPELQRYRREAAARRGARRGGAAAAAAAAAGQGGQGGQGGRWAVLAAARAGERGVRALGEAGAALVQLAVRWRGGGEARAEASVASVARLARGRAAHGLAAWGGGLLACGGYDRAEVLGAVELLEEKGGWRALAELPRPRARFSLAACGAALLAVGGCDGLRDLDSVLLLRAHSGGVWEKAPSLPTTVSQGAACGIPESELVICAGGGAACKDVYVYKLGAESWTEGPPLLFGRSAAAACVWNEAVWILGGSDSWRCLASTERLPIVDGSLSEEWSEGPPMPIARRSLAAVSWKESLLAIGGADGSHSLRRVDALSSDGSQWSRISNLREPRAALQAAALKGVLYAVGGYSGQQQAFLSSVEVLHELDGEWTSLKDPLLSPAQATPTTPVAPEELKREDDKKQDPAPVVVNGEH